MLDAQKVTIKDIAKAAGVSVSTVSRALNSTGRINSSSQERIREIVDEMGYKPNMAAQSLKTQRTRNIFLVVPDVTNPFYSSLAKELQAFVGKKNYILTLFNTNEALQEELNAIRTAVEISAGGIVFASVSESMSVIMALKEAKIPTVLLNSYGACEFDTVHGEVNVGTHLATKYLIEKGHTQIAFAGASTETIIGKSREQGYIQAMVEAGLSLDRKLIFEMGFSEDAGYKAGKYFMSLRRPPSAICCANDILAMGVLNALHEEGIKVPKQMSVTGMDDIIYSRISNPPLTTVTNDSFLFARYAFELVFQRIEGREPMEPREIILPRELVIRNSVDIPNHLNGNDK